MKDITSLDVIESIRLRPGMYIGRVNNQGFTGLLKNIFSSSLFNNSPDSFEIHILENHSAKIILKNIQNTIIDTWSKWVDNKSHHWALNLIVLNSLS